jgi:hypothetical protein
MESKWLVPQDENSLRVWGIRGGIGFGIAPTPGPRGLIRIYTPYLNQPPLRMLNFIAVEPVVRGHRALSELEKSKIDGQTGKVFTVENPQGLIKKVRGTEIFTVTVHIEKFDNGAHPRLEITLHANQLQEVTFRVFAEPDSAPMDACVLTATMGNYAHLRQLHLAKETVTCSDLWPVFTPDAWNFAPWKEISSDRLKRTKTEVILEATSDEAHPERATYAPSVFAGWHYEGKPSLQRWSAPHYPGIRARVNARKTYWGESGEIPGGMAFENIELYAPFQEGQEFRFVALPLSP